MSSYFEGAYKSESLYLALNDFHFLLWVSNYLKEQGKEEIVKKLIAYIKGDRDLEKELRSDLQDTFTRAEQVRNPTLHILTAQIPPKKPTPTVDRTTDPKIGQIMEMGYPEHMAREALEVSGGSLEAAINYLLSDIH